MQGYMRILERVPNELKEPLVDLAEAIESRLRSELSVPRYDFGHLDRIVTELAQAHKRSEERLEKSEGRLDRIEALVEELAQAQTETRTELKALTQATAELAQAQKRTDKAVEELAQAQKRTEEQVAKLAQEQLSFKHSFESKIGALGARWGVSAETSFRDAMRSILVDLGLQVEKYLEWDAEGKVFGHPDQVELDVVIQDGRLILIEIKSAMNKSDVYRFENKIKFYEEKEKKTPNRKLIVSPFVDSYAMAVADRLGMEVFTDINSVS